MESMRRLAIATFLVVLVAVPAMAVPIVVTVGDNDGYGFGLPDNGIVPGLKWPGPGSSGENYDGRSAGEAAAVNGAQITDVYSAIFPGFGPNTSSTASVFFPFAGSLNSGSLTIDMGDFQSSTFGAISANVNGIPLAFTFDDGFLATAVRSFTLTPAMLLAANGAGEVILNLDHTGSNDFVAFDYFQLQGDTSVPEPATLGLLGLGLSALALRRRRRG